MLTVSIPDEIDQQLSLLTSNKEEFIMAAIRQKIAMRRKAVSPEELAQEYAGSVAENKAIADDYTHADQENWNDD